MVLEVSNVALSYGATEILKDVTFQIHEKERVSLVGHNGCGKTTLLNILTGELDASAGTVTLKNKATIGYLKQMSGLDPANTLYNEMKSVNGADRLLRRMKELEATMGTDKALVAEYEDISLQYEAIDGYNLDFNIRKILNGLAFPPETYEKKVGVLSGGEKTRLALAKLLIMNPDLLILDEPTNHLDLDTMEWLEEFLMNYGKAVLVVSHDRHFLDRISTKTVEIQNGKSHVYSGNYTAFLQQKEINDTTAQRTYEKTAKYAEKLADYAQKNMARASTSNMAKSRLKMLERLDVTAPEQSEHVHIRFRIEPAGQPYKEVLTTKDLSVKIGGKVLVQGLELELLRGERLAIIGANGTGKTTLLRVINGQLAPASGRLRMGGGVKTSYLEQHLNGIRSANPLEFIWDLYPAMDQLGIRNLLASVGFRGEDVFTDARGLSGGELARLNLARISLEHPNLLILDEPTNHLDIYTKDILCDTLSAFEGTMIVVTHDRYLMEVLNSRILLLEGEGKWQLFESYAQYRRFRETGEMPSAEPAAKKPAAEEPSTQLNAKELRRQRAAERERKAAVEKEIEELEKEVFYLEEALQDPAAMADYEKLSDISEKLDYARDRLSVLTDEWLEKFADD